MPPRVCWLNLAVGLAPSLLLQPDPMDPALWLHNLDFQTKSRLHPQAGFVRVAPGQTRYAGV